MGLGIKLNTNYLLTELERATAEAEHIRRIATLLVKAEDYAKTCELIVNECRNAFKADALSLHMLQPDGVYEMVAESGCSAEYKKDWRHVTRDRIPLVNKSNPHDCLFYGSVADLIADLPNDNDKGIMNRSGRRTIVYAPLVVNQSPIGMLGFSYNAPNYEISRDFTMTIVNLCAQSLECIRLFEKERLARKNAEVANKAKTVFLANISHELRTPMSAIQGFAQLIYDTSNVSNEVKSWATRLLKNSQYLTHLIGGIIDISKVEAKALDIRSEYFMIHDLIEEIKETTLFKAEEKGLSLKFLVPSDEIKFCSDSLHLRQILINLVGNAIKFTTTGHIEVEFKICNKTLSIFVRDTGIGIAEIERQRIFERFVQTDNGIQKSLGSGLGLTISKELAQALGGDISLVSSQPGYGSTFLVEIPEAKPIEKNKSNCVDSKATQKLKNLRILVAEDMPDLQYLLNKFLTKQGAEVDVVDNGIAVVDRALGGDYDIIIMDVQMPKQGGLESTQLLRDKNYKKPIVALTAFALTNEREKAFSCGVNDYLTKPVNTSKLVQTIQRLVHYH